MTALFRFKQFTIAHDRCAMKVGTDGILLGAWAKMQSPHRILDIGTGTGLIALMLAQRFPDADIRGVEVDAAACEQASGNFQASPWSHRLTAVCECIRSFASRAVHQSRYCLVVSNPPWFIESLKSGNLQRDQARHTGSLDSAELISAVASLLSEHGRFCTILPVEQKSQFLNLAEDRGLYCQHCCDVLPTESKPVKRALLELSFHKQAQETQQSQLVVETDQRHVYTSGFMALTKEFYLRF